MGNYLPHTHTQRRPLKKRALANWTVAAAPSENIERREQIANERELEARREVERRQRMAARRDQRASDALRTEARRNLEVKAQLLFPWDLMAPDRKIAAVLTGQPLGAMYPVFELAIPFSGVNLGISPRELGISEPAANFMTLSAPRTCSWSELMRAADFFLEVQAFEDRALDRAALMDKAKDALTRLEGRLSGLPDWLTIHELRGSWFIVRPTRETAKRMWEEVIASKPGAAP